jgi:hypothetical protein
VGGFFELDVVISGMRVDCGEFEGIVGTSCHYAFIEVVEMAFLYFRVVERNGGVFLDGFMIILQLYPLLLFLHKKSH